MPTLTINHQFRPPRDETNGVPRTSSGLLHAGYGIYNDRNGETTTMTGPARKERTGQGRVWNGRDGGIQRKYVHATQSGSLSLSRCLFSALSPHLRHHTNIPSQTNPTKTTRETDRERHSRARREGRSPEKASKHLGNGVLYIHPQGGGRSSMLWLWSKGRKKTQTTPPFLFLLSLNSVYCAPVLVWSFFCFLLLLYWHPRYCLLPSSSVIAHRS